MSEVTYKPQGVCCKEIKFEIDNNIVKNIRFLGGCPGGLQAISRLCNGKTVPEIIQLLGGTICGNKGTSCSDQLVKAIKEPVK